MATLKLFVGGTPKSGKTEFIRSVTNFPLITVDKKIVPPCRVVEMDYGRVHVAPHMVYLYAPVKETDYTFLWHGLHGEMNGALVLFDGTRREILESANEIYQILETHPMIAGAKPAVVVTHSDATDSIPLAYIKSVFANDAIIFECNATVRASVLQVLKNWMTCVVQSLE